VLSRQLRASVSRRQRLSVSSVQVSNVLSTPRIVYDQVSKQSFIVTRNATPRQPRKKTKPRARPGPKRVSSVLQGDVIPQSTWTIRKNESISLTSSSETRLERRARTSAKESKKKRSRFD